MEPIPESVPCPKCGEPRDSAEDLSKKHTSYEKPKQGKECRKCGFKFEGGLFKNV